VAKYLSFRMRAAGYRGPEVFAPRAVRRVSRASGGLTRRINILADKALLAAYTENTHAITDRHVRAAVADSEFAASRKWSRPLLYLGAALAAGAAIGAAAQWMATLPARAPQPAARLEKPAPPPQPPSPQPASALEPEPEPAPQAEPPPPEPQLTAEQASKLAGYSAAGQRLLGERLAATRDVLGRADEEHYALELFVTENTDPARMERFLLRARELVPLEELYVIPMAGGGDYRLRVVFGEFASREEAVTAARRLPPRYQEAFRATPRSFGELRRQL
jgi:MSHA biogenesis protein MshM